MLPCDQGYLQETCAQMIELLLLLLLLLLRYSAFHEQETNPPLRLHVPLNGGPYF
jgi:hypothetical protein